MPYKYKVGDWVRVQSFDYLPSGFVQSMGIHMGSVYRVKFANDGWYELSDYINVGMESAEGWMWAEEWLEPADAPITNVDVGELL